MLRTIPVGDFEQRASSAENTETGAATDCCLDWLRQSLA
jgi:hypothetical protein